MSHGEAGSVGLDRPGLSRGRPSGRAADQHRRGGEFLWRRGRTGGRRQRDRQQHPEQSRPGSASVRGEPVGRARFSRPQRSSIYNGADYDPWMAKLLAAARSPNRTVIVVADLVRKKPGDNPHLWYDPPTMPAYAKALAAALSQRDPAHKAGYDQRLQAFLDWLQPLQAKIADIACQFAVGFPVTATEPVFGYMATALGFKMRNERFQLAVMNDTEPRASDVAAFEDDLRQHRVRMLFYNSQATRHRGAAPGQDRASSRRSPLSG